jgi:hypothetical protein
MGPYSSVEYDAPQSYRDIYKSYEHNAKDEMRLGKDWHSYESMFGAREYVQS